MAHFHLLSAQQMRIAESTMFSKGVKSYALMWQAGLAVAETIIGHYPNKSVIVVVGVGNNGGDGLIAAQALFEQGVDVSVVRLEETKQDSSDAARAARDYQGKILPLGDEPFPTYAVIIDALYGIGINRPISGDAAYLIKKMNASGLPIISIDIPSGINPDTGAVMGFAVKADLTIAFERKKYGHYLMPGTDYCGKIVVIDIGIDDDAIASSHPHVSVNCKDIWQDNYPWPKPDDYKYRRGHTLIVGGEAKRAGAAKLAAMAALRTGSGLVSIVCDKAALPVYAATALSLMTEELENWSSLLQDPHNNVILIGPGAGVNTLTYQRTLDALHAKKSIVIDADALSVFSGVPDTLFSSVASPCIMTPHMGEFTRLFGEHSGQSKLQITINAAKRAHAVVILKGYDTIIASPDGRAVINSNATPTLATAGTGDVLAGICAGLLAQGMDPFLAACAAVWIHSEAGLQLDAGLISEDLLLFLPTVLKKIKHSA